MESQILKIKSPVLKDTSGRIIRKLRVSLTDACNYRCFYCMPEEASFMQQSKLMSPAEFQRICSGLTSQGITRIRVTGGEPTLRKDFSEIMSRLGSLPHIQLALTSNGEFLEPHLNMLQEVGCQSLNISMDSLDEGKFTRITHGGNLVKVKSCIQKAVSMGFQVKVNCVVFRDINSNELGDFYKWSLETGVEVRFLEFMKIGPSYQKNYKRFISAEEMIAILEKDVHLQKAVDPFDSTSIGYVTEMGGRLGFIASESKPFCGSCSRLRLSATGDLRSCLMSEAGVNVRHRALSEYPSILDKVMSMKPLDRFDHVNQAMYQIGG